MKKFVSMFLALAMCLSLAAPAMAAEPNNAMPGEEESFYDISFDNSENVVDYNMPFSLEAPHAEDHTYSTLTFLGTKYVVEEDLGYHPDTSLWVNVASYTFSKTQTVEVNIGVMFGNEIVQGTIGVGRSVSTGVGRTINADQTRYSKVRVYATYYADAYRCDIYDEFTNELISSSSYVSTRPVGIKYVVEYRDSL